MNIGVITLHECAAIYAGGIFGEISELYVKPEFSSLKVGELLLASAIEYGKDLKLAALLQMRAQEHSNFIKNKDFNLQALGYVI